MTLAEVIDTLQTWIRNADDEYDREEMGRVVGLKEALHEIKRIEPYEDCISRQELKERFLEKCVSDCSCCEYWRDDDWCEIFNELPTVQPKQKTGHWVFDEILDRHYYCSECKSMGVDYWDYCPNCGAKMAERGEK